MKPMKVLGVASSMRESLYGTRTLRIGRRCSTEI